MTIIIETIPYFNDNYSYLIHSEETGATVLIDCGDAEAVLERLKEKGWHLDVLLLTHHHYDHTGDVATLIKELPQTQVLIPAGEKRIRVKATEVHDREIFWIKDLPIQPIDVSAHTLPCYSYLIDENLFVGDALFSGGCGRLFEGGAMELEKAMDTFRAFSPSTKIYFGHEYTLANLSFAKRAEPENPYLESYRIDCEKKRAAGLFTTPSTIQTELQINPFLRIDEESVIHFVDPQRKYPRQERLLLLRKIRDQG